MFMGLQEGHDFVRSYFKLINWTKGFFITSAQKLRGDLKPLMSFNCCFMLCSFPHHFLINEQ